MIGKVKDIIDWLLEQDKEKIFEIKEFKKKRSLNSNAYLWVLCTEIANIMTLSKEDVYVKMLEDYGVSILVPLTVDTEPEKYFKYYSYFDKGKLNGKECIWYKVFKGSSEYDSKEMTHLLNGVVEEAKQLGIMTLDEIEIQEMLDRWVQ